MHPRLRIDHIREALGIIDPVFLNTPQFVSDSLSELTGARVVVKVETVNPLRSFKGRGSEYYVSHLQRGEKLMAASAGNLGQAMAYACRRRGLALTVYAGAQASPFKIERMRALGAEVVIVPGDFEDARREAEAAAARLGVRLVQDSLDPETGEGAGTIGVELAAFGEPLDAVLVALGNGALACGMGVYLKHVSPLTRIVAVQAGGAPAMIESWKRGSVVRHDSVHTIADGIAVRNPIPACVLDMDGVIDDGLLVDDEALISAMRLAHRHLGLALEPAGAAGLAALMQNRAAFAGKTVAVVLCGGNLSPEQSQKWLF